MDPLYREDDDPAEEEEYNSKYKYFLYWFLRPMVRGIAFGLGHFLTLKIVGPYIASKVAEKSQA
eukprot:CAMPEP_0204905348 /NCGR_PEP_ID=MMETSP1397-20131031/5373_1 /ASSEMBLY_ACC=CAM_ASM_000891 /TAXON_ID=49980 /ORGANISM="Climacostomum Climacostomum virens, Strain Stock W-24" /LENGTH=63 /DNA_ID=CAMNT_0052074221 /DNA_START=99 /DNA_END=290 /DNA_ORIENTATION=-